MTATGKVNEAILGAIETAVMSMETNALPNEAMIPTTLAESVPTESISAEPVPIDTDGPRAKHLKQALRKALNNTIKSCSGDRLETCFPFNLRPAQMAAIDEAIVGALQAVADGAQGPFEQILQEEGLVERLNRVDDFVKSQAPGGLVGGTAAAPSASTTATTTGTVSNAPQSQLNRKLVAVKAEALQRVHSQLSALQADNEALASALQQRHDDFIERLEQIRTSQHLLDSALNQVSSVSLEELDGLVDRMMTQSRPVTELAMAKDQ